jgi:DNA-binding NarL/FixJ family response regulator
VETLQNQRKVLMLGADPLVCDNVRVLLTSMGYQCLVASALKRALELLEQEKPDAVIVDPYFTDAPAVRLAAMFYKQVPALRGRSIVLLREKSDPELVQVLDAYAVPRIRLGALFQDLWPSLVSLLRRAAVSRQITHAALLVFDSFLEPSVAGIRSSQVPCRQLRYESDALAADLLLEQEQHSQRITLTGQVLDAAKGQPKAGVPVVIQGPSSLIGVAKTSEWGEFRSDFEPEAGITLEIRTKQDFWVSARLPDLSSFMRRAPESQTPETSRSF